LARQKTTLGLFHKVASPDMIGENTNQNDNSAWSLLHRTSDKRLQQRYRQISAV